MTGLGKRLWALVFGLSVLLMAGQASAQSLDVRVLLDPIKPNAPGLVGVFIPDQTKNVVELGELQTGIFVPDDPNEDIVEAIGEEGAPVVMSIDDDCPEDEDGPEGPDPGGVNCTNTTKTTTGGRGDSGGTNTGGGGGHPQSCPAGYYWDAGSGYCVPKETYNIPGKAPHVPTDHPEVPDPGSNTPYPNDHGEESGAGGGVPGGGGGNQENECRGILCCPQGLVWDDARGACIDPNTGWEQGNQCKKDSDCPGEKDRCENGWCVSEDIDVEDDAPDLCGGHGTWNTTADRCDCDDEYVWDGSTCQKSGCQSHADCYPGQCEFETGLCVAAPKSEPMTACDICNVNIDACTLAAREVWAVTCESKARDHAFVEAYEENRGPDNKACWGWLWCSGVDLPSIPGQGGGGTVPWGDYIAPKQCEGEASCTPGEPNWKLGLSRFNQCALDFEKSSFECYDEWMMGRPEIRGSSGDSVEVGFSFQGVGGGYGVKTNLLVSHDGEKGFLKRCGEETTQAVLACVAEGSQCLINNQCPGSTPQYPIPTEPNGGPEL